MGNLPHIKTQHLPILLRSLAEMFRAMREVYSEMDAGPLATAEADLERAASKIEDQEAEIRLLRQTIERIRDDHEHPF